MPGGIRGGILFESKEYAPGPGRTLSGEVRVSPRLPLILVLDKKLSKLLIAPQARQELMRRLLRRLPQKGDADSGAFLIKIKDFYQERV